MLRLTNNPVLTTHQKKMLTLFFSAPLGQRFFLTGGTALSAFYLAHRLSKKWVQRFDFVQEQPILFGERKTVDGVIVDNLENIASGKILAIYGRFEPKDYIDLYFICKETPTNFFTLFEKTKKKDAGLSEFYFANMIADVKNLREFPKMLKHFDKHDFETFFLTFSDQLFKRIKPKR